MSFNDRAAQAAYDLVMKMDEDEARAFVEIVVADVLEQTIEKNLRALQGHLDYVVAKRIKMVKQATLRAVSKQNDQHSVNFASALIEIEKANGWVEHEHPRDKGGLFKTKIHTNVGDKTKPIHPKTAHSIGIKPPHGTQGYRQMDDKQKAKYQQEYAQLANFLTAVQHSTKNPGDLDLYLNYHDSQTGESFTEKVHGSSEAKPSYLRPNEENVSLTSIEARPTNLTVAGATFGLTSALGGTGASAGRFSESVGGLDQSFPKFANSWMNEGNVRNSNEKLYNRVGAGSDLLGSVSSDPRVQVASRFGQFVGSHGAEAERVIGPTARRTAYRYRGTSRPVDLKLAREYNAALINAKVRTDIGERDLGMTQQAALRASAQRRKPSAAEEQQARHVIDTYFRGDPRNPETFPGRMPKKGLYNLQLASGNTPPSEGVILNSDGRLVEQAVGYGDDHYLPFNLKKLKELKGGQYIRTRSVGGLTTEDIYTGLMTGAKQVTVVSRSGTFTMTFEDDFKGGRRYNDKALRMTKRYGQILDAVQSQQVDKESLDPSIRIGIAAKVREDTRGWGLSGKEVNDEIERRVTSFKDSPAIGDDEYELADFMARKMQIRADAGEIPQRDVDDFKGSVMSDLAREKEFKFRLNGAGYASALDALQEQFPYYINVNSNPLREERHEVELDRGYVEPGRNRPTAAAAGLFGAHTKHAYKDSPGKFSAADANFQDRGRGPSGGVPAPGGTLTPTGDHKNEVTDKVAEVRQQIVLASVVPKVQALGRRAITASDQQLHPQLSYTPQDLQDPVKQAEFVKWGDDLFAMAEQNHWTIPNDLKIEWAEASGRIGQQDYNPEQHRGLFGDKPYKFKTSNKDKQVAALDERTHSGITSTKKLSEMTDMELRAEHTSALSAKNMLASMGDRLSAEDKIKMLETSGVQQGAPGLLRAMKSTHGFDEHLDAVHEMRALRQGVADKDRLSPITVKPPLPTEEEKKGPKAGLEALVWNFETAAKFYEDNGVPDKGDILRVAASDIKDQLKHANSAQDVKIAQSAYSEQIQMVKDMYAHKHTKGTVDTVGDGNILS